MTLRRTICGFIYFDTFICSDNCTYLKRNRENSLLGILPIGSYCIIYEQRIFMHHCRVIKFSLNGFFIINSFSRLCDILIHYWFSIVQDRSAKWSRLFMEVSSTYLSTRWLASYVGFMIMAIALGSLIALRNTKSDQGSNLSAFMYEDWSDVVILKLLRLFNLNNARRLCVRMHFKGLKIEFQYYVNLSFQAFDSLFSVPLRLIFPLRLRLGIVRFLRLKLRF